MKILRYLTRWLLLAFSALPLRVHYAWARFFAWVLKDVMHYRRDVVMTNLARSFPDKKYGELRQISSRFYRHFGDIIAEAIWFGGRMDPAKLHKQHLVETVNPEVVDEAFAHSPSVMILNTHCGNWEILGGFFEYDYREPPAERPCGIHDAVVVYKPLESRFWDEIMRLNRCAPILRRGFKGYVSFTSVLRYAVTHRAEKKIYIMNSDQFPYGKAMTHEMVDFMHQPTETMFGAASLAKKFGMSVLYMNMSSVSRGHNELRFTEICRDASTMEPRQIMEKYYSLLQNDLDRLPWNYLWTHQRWK